MCCRFRRAQAGECGGRKKTIQSRSHKEPEKNREAESKQRTRTWGDIAIAPERRFAKKKRSLNKGRRSLHGVLHLLGYDHETDRRNEPHRTHDAPQILGWHEHLWWVYTLGRSSRLWRPFFYLTLIYRARRMNTGRVHGVTKSLVIGPSCESSGGAAGGHSDTWGIGWRFWCWRQRGGSLLSRNGVAAEFVVF
jgi:hypothetical protein